MKRPPLPAYAKVAGKNRAGSLLVDVDPDEFYPAFFAELAKGVTEAAKLAVAQAKASGAAADQDKAKTLVAQAKAFRAAADGKEPDRFSLEVAYQAAKMDVQAALGFQVEIRHRSGEGRKAKWRQADKPGTETDVALATQGKEAREHYKTIRGFLPG